MPSPPSRRRIARLHVGLAIAVVLCGTAFAVEILRALGGNTLSWAYVFEWPILLAYGVYMWQRLVREERNGSRNATPTPSGDSEDDAALEAWNRYLQELHAAEGSSTPLRQPRARPSSTVEESAGRTSDGSTAASTPFTNLGEASVE